MVVDLVIALLRCRGCKALVVVELVPVVVQHNGSVKVTVELMLTVVHVFVLAVVQCGSGILILRGSCRGRVGKK